MWDELLDTCVYAYNTSVHESTAFTSFELMFGQRAVLPIDLEVDDRSPDDVLQQQQNDSQDSITAVEHITNHSHKLTEVVKMNIVRAKKQKEQYNRKHANSTAFAIGEKVLKKAFRRIKRAGGEMYPRYLGPYPDLLFIDIPMLLYLYLRQC